MEGFKYENNPEKQKGISIVLDKEKLRNKFWGKSREIAIAEYIKVFAIIKHIKETGISTKKEIKNVAEDLFKEFEVTGFDYTDILTDDVINEIQSSNKIDSISIDLNNIPAFIDSNSTVESVMNNWKEMWGRKTGVNSPEATEKWEREQKSRKEAAQQEQIILDKMLIELDTLDFSDQEKAIDWLYEYYTHHSDGVDMHDDKVGEKFEVHGYTPEHNNAIDGMLGEALKDKKKLGNVIIGYLLENGSLSLRDNWLKDSIADWKKL